MKLLRIFMYKFLYERMFLFLLSNFLGVECLPHMVGVCLIFKKV